MRKVIVSISVIGCLIPFSAQIKEGGITEVTVQGKFLELPLEKVSENISVISKKEIDNSSAQSIEELLAEYTGFDIRRRGGNGVQADISLRGSNFEQVLILVNGVRINDSQTGHNSMNIPFDLMSVEKIEVIKGPAARRFGQNAFAGVVNIITKPSSEEQVTVAASGGDFETYSLGLGAQYGSDVFSNFVQLNSSASEGYRHNTDYKINNVFYQNQFKIRNGQLNFQAGIQEKKFGANGFYASPKATEQYEETQASLVSAGVEQKFNDLKINANLYWRRGQDMYLYTRSNPNGYRNMHIGNNVGTEVNGTYTSKLGTTGLGVELRKEFLVSNNLGARDRFLTQLFLEHHVSFFNDRFHISPGLSWAKYDTAGDFFYPGIDVGFDINGHHKIYGNVAKVNRIPTFTDLFYVSKTERGNPLLQPESAVSSELGYRYLNGGFSGKLSVFNRTSDNSIDWVQENPQALWTVRNIGETTNGAEVELRQSLDFVIKSWSAGYTFLDSTSDNLGTLTSRYQKQNLKHQFVGKVAFSVVKNIEAQAVYRYHERVSTGSYQLVDGRLNYAQKGLNIYILANNITNTEYTEAFGVPMPGRWFHVGFSYDIKL